MSRHANIARGGVGGHLFQMMLYRYLASKWIDRGREKAGSRRQGAGSGSRNKGGNSLLFITGYY